MLLNDDKFQTLKNYCKIDHDFDDELLKALVDSTALELTRAISYTAEPSDYVTDSRFFIALMKQVSENYYQRGLTADNYRPELTDTVSGIINQLRSELDETNAHDWADNFYS